MKRFRRHRLRTRLAIFAIVGLLWSHLALAGHSACMTMTMTMAMAAPEVTAMAESGCQHDQASLAETAVCDTHCGQGGQSSDTPRAPLPLPLPIGPLPALVAMAGLLPASLHILGLPPRVHWHRPTTHPAALLLI